MLLQDISLCWASLSFPLLSLLLPFTKDPPIRWSYRGLGEPFIFLSYGPTMTLGSYYVQVQRIDLVAALASLIPGLLIFVLAIINKIPDFYRDKRNIVIRIEKGCLFISNSNTFSFCHLGVGLAS